MSENKIKKYQCKVCSNKCVIECSDEFFPISCPLNNLTNCDWLIAKWNEVENEFIDEFKRVMKKAESFKEKFGMDFALGWYLGKMITPEILRKENERK